MSTHPPAEWLRRLVMLGVPPAIAILELWHVYPSGPDLYHALSHQPALWKMLHIIQLPLFGLAAYAVYLLTADLGGGAAKVSRLGLGVFVIFYTALDAIIGIGVGTLIRAGQQLPPEQQEGVARAIYQLAIDPVAGGTFPSLLPMLGTLGWLAGGLGAAYALYKEGSPRPPLIFLALSSLILIAGHPRPFGPLAFGCLFVATLWLELAGRGAAVRRGRARDVREQG